jgi:hypothetical protein
VETTPHEINDDVLEISSDSETETPKNEFTLFIKVPTSSKKKNRKSLVSDSIPKSKPKDGEVNEDSVIYLNEEEIRNSCKKKKKTGGKKNTACKVKRKIRLKSLVGPGKKCKVGAVILRIFWNLFFLLEMTKKICQNLIKKIKNLVDFIFSIFSWNLCGFSRTFRKPHKSQKKVRTSQRYVRIF